MIKWKENIQKILKMEILDWKQNIKRAYRMEKQQFIMKKEENKQYAIIKKEKWKENIFNFMKAEKLNLNVNISMD